MRFSDEQFNELMGKLDEIKGVLERIAVSLNDFQEIFFHKDHAEPEREK